MNDDRINIEVDIRWANTQPALIDERGKYKMHVHFLFHYQVLIEFREYVP
jgi:hypothetical protein